MATQNEQEIAYNRYLREHQKYVGITWRLIRPDYDQNLQQKMDRIVSVHDVSKFSREEFPGYRQFFYPANGETKDDALFTKAWGHHKANNPHHWDHWIVEGAKIEMPLVCVLEMLCDWGAMELYFKGNLLGWYASHRERIMLHTNTEILILEHIANVAAKVQEYNNGGAQYANDLPD